MLNVVVYKSGLDFTFYLNYAQILSCITEMERYLEVSREQNYNSEQALALLYWHRMDVAAAQADLTNFTPRPNSWSPQEKAAFANTLQV